MFVVTKKKYFQVHLDGEYFLAPKLNETSSTVAAEKLSID